MHEFTSSEEASRDDCLVDQLYRRHAPGLFAFLRHHTATREDAEDLLLEVFLSALEQAHLVEMDEERQAAWLWRVARNRAIDSYRRSAHRPVVALERVETELYEDETQSPEESALRREEYRRLQIALRSLTPLQREVLQMRFADDLQSVEIAAALGKKQAAVRVLLMRTLRFLRTMYTDSTASKLTERRRP
jgi:RNA polymerase sigma factor (sigma-70 family)